MQNRSNKIAVFRLSKDLRKATFVKALTDPDFDVPTTIDRAGKRLYAVNARFGTATPDDQQLRRRQGRITRVGQAAARG